VLRIDGIDVAIGSVSILRGVSLAVGRGQFAGLVGRNGAGKTTLLRTVMGLLEPRRGSLHFEGTPLEGVPAHLRSRRGIGYMPEDRRLVPDLTVEENILLPAWAARLPDSAGRLERIYRTIPEVERLGQSKALQLSGGQQKLVALARALMSGTRLLLLDEPFEGVAPVLARRLAEVIGQLKREGLAAVLCESDLTHSREMLDVVFTIDRGAVAPPQTAGAPAS
jgi:branched-chain amino acid transport system ATP-binding protein